MKTAFLFDDGVHFVDNQEFFMMSHLDYPKTNTDLACSDSSNKFPCPKCTSVFRQKRSLTRHLKYECQKSPRFKCPYCLYRTKKTSDAYAHVRKKHRKQEVYIIDIEASPHSINIRRPKF